MAKKNPTLSIVVIFYNMQREAARTLHSLSSAYQIGMLDTEYEVIVIDNGSKIPLDPEGVKKFGTNFSYHFYDTKSVSPAAAVNFGAQQSRSENLAIIVDGARMVTPNMVGQTLKALQSYDNPFVCALGWHLGPDVQNRSMLMGYNQSEEDRLLERIDWRKDGYALFDISVLAQSSRNGFYGGMPAECSWFAMLRRNFISMGGYDERFQMPGGGLVNHDFLERVLAQEFISPILILGEGSFHQFHGGVATNVRREQHPFRKFAEEYERLKGRTYSAPKTKIEPHYFGETSKRSLKFSMI